MTQIAPPDGAPRPLDRSRLVALGQQLAGTFDPDTVLSILAKTVAETLALPYVAVYVNRQDSGEFVLAAQFPSGLGEEDPTQWSSSLLSGSMPNTEFPMGGYQILAITRQDEVVGYLVIAPPSPNRVLSLEDRQLLRELTRQVAPAVGVVRTVFDLRRACERLVLTREEERRRLRRNLHNSIGPTLAALNLRAGSVRAMISRDPAAAESEMGELRQQIRNIITDIRRVVYDLRPPVLDELGLRTALREQCAQFTTGGLRVSLECPESFPPISAAVEVAAYRIVQEGLSNVARHSRAGQATVRIGFGDGFVRIEVNDDGVGVPETQRAGVGVTSMRELAVEIGGTCVLEPAPGGGSRVRANLPMDLRAAERPHSSQSRG
ncbi:MAG: GAF domain-containing sensor histidine kinase [Thermoflexales bacterium]|jgi:signal transduction histidine kinase|nr:GAF domain-containing sensor histidine kinase [Thermoflexales bacterium]